MRTERQTEKVGEKDLLPFLRSEGYKKRFRPARWQLAWHLFATLSLTLSLTDKIQYLPRLFALRFDSHGTGTTTTNKVKGKPKSVRIYKCDKFNVRNLQKHCFRWPLRSAHWLKCCPSLFFQSRESEKEICMPSDTWSIDYSFCPHFTLL